MTDDMQIMGELDHQADYAVPEAPTGGKVYSNNRAVYLRFNNAVQNKAQEIGTPEPDQPEMSEEELMERIERFKNPKTTDTLVQMARSTAPEPVVNTSPEAMLLNKNNEVNNAYKIYELFEGEPFDGLPEDAIEYALDAMGEFAFNFLGPVSFAESGFDAGGTLAQAAHIISAQDPDKAKAFVDFMEQYERLPTWSYEGLGRAFRGIFSDPTTYATAGAGYLLSKAGTQVAATGAKRAIQELAKRPMMMAAAEGAAYTGGGEEALMGVEEASGREISGLEKGLRRGISTTIGAAAGPTLMKGAQVGGQVAGEIAEAVGKPTMQAIGNVIESAGEAAQARMDEGGTTLSSGVDIDPLIAGAGNLVKSMRGEQAQSHPGRISTRQPSEKAAQDNPEADPINNQLVIGLDEAKASGGKAFNHNVAEFQRSVNMTEAEAKLPPEEGAEAFINHVKDNLLWLFDKVPEATRQRSKLWYDGARSLTDEWSTQYNVPDASIAGILAALSPQKDWYQNVSLGKRVLDILTEKTNVPFDDKMAAKANEVFPKKSGLINLLKGKTLDELETTAEKAIWLRFYDEVYNAKDYNILNPEGTFGGKVYNDDGSLADMAWGTMNTIEKAINSFYSNGDRATLSRLMGERHKVRNFYNNILDPNGVYGDVTIDTHAVAAGLLRPLSASSYDVFRAFGTAPTKEQRKKFDVREGAEWTPAKSSAITGQRGTYAFYAEAYRRAAQERGILPREMQSITWEAVRGLFSPTFKGDEKNVKMVREIWQQYRKGKIGLDDARNKIEEVAGGITPPTWE